MDDARRRAVAERLGECYEHRDAQDFRGRMERFRECCGECGALWPCLTHDSGFRMTSCETTRRTIRRRWLRRAPTGPAAVLAAFLAAVGENDG